MRTAGVDLPRLRIAPMPTVGGKRAADRARQRLLPGHRDETVASPVMARQVRVVSAEPPRSRPTTRGAKRSAAPRRRSRSGTTLLAPGQATAGSRRRASAVAIGRLAGPVTPATTLDLSRPGRSHPSLTTMSRRRGSSISRTPKVSWRAAAARPPRLATGLQRLNQGREPLLVLIHPRGPVPRGQSIVQLAARLMRRHGPGPASAARKRLWPRLRTPSHLAVLPRMLREEPDTRSGRRLRRRRRSPEESRACSRGCSLPLNVCVCVIFFYLGG